MKTLSITELRQLLQEDYAELGGGWRAVGRRWGIGHALAYRIATNGYEPKSLKIREQLGLAIMAPAPVCPKCGIVHVSKRCPSTRVKHGDLLSMPVDVLKWKIENREDYDELQNVPEQERPAIPGAETG